MNENKLHAYLISYNVDKGTYHEVKNVVVVAYTKKQAIKMLVNSIRNCNTIAVDFGEEIEIIKEIISIQTVRKNKQNAHWFTQETYKRELELTGLKGK